MTTPDTLGLAQRAFNTPLFIEPAKAAVIARALGGRFLGLPQDAGLSVDAGDVSITARHEGVRAPAAGMIGDEMHRYLSESGRGYSVIEGVAIVPVVGSTVRRGAWIGSSSGMVSYEGISAQVRAAAADDRVRAIALEIDSFGGEAAGMFALAEEIRAAGAEKPVRAFVADYALSAGYGIASAAHHITVPRNGMAGSIGVVMMHVDIEQKLAAEGTRVTLIHAGARKVEGNGFEKLPGAVRDAWQADIDRLWGEFAHAVEAGRGDRLSAAAALKLEAGTFTGDKAVAKGLADEVAEARAAFAAWVESLRPEAAQLPAAALAAPAVSSGRLAWSEPKFPNGGAIAAPSVLQTEHGLSTRGDGRMTGGETPHHKESEMSKDVTTPDAETQPDQKAPEASQSNSEAVAAERMRASRIMAKVAKAGLPGSLASELIAEGVSLEVAYERILDAKAEKAEDGGEIRTAHGAATVLSDGRDRTRDGMTAALKAKAGLDGGERNEFSSMTLKEMARASMQAQGVTIPKGGQMQMIAAAFVPSMAGGMHSTSDFTNILADVANKSMLKGFMEAAETFEAFTSTGTMSDFKPTRKVGLDAFPSLTQVAEGAEFSYGTMGDHGETAMLATYGKLFGISRQTIINDNLDAFTVVPRNMGRAARRTVGDLAFAVLSANAAMSDGTALFHADHGNLAGSGGAPSEAALNAGIVAMASQTDRAGTAKLNVSPRFILAGWANRSTVLQTLNSEMAPDDTEKAGTTKQPRAANTVYKAADPIFDARITGNEWYLLADPSQYDTIEIGYLDGVSTPFMDQQDGWSIDGTEFKVRIDACATALAWQGLYKNAGA